MHPLYLLSPYVDCWCVMTASCRHKELNQHNLQLWYMQSLTITNVFLSCTVTTFPWFWWCISILGFCVSVTMWLYMDEATLEKWHTNSLSICQYFISRQICGCFVSFDDGWWVSFLVLVTTSHFLIVWQNRLMTHNDLRKWPWCEEFYTKHTFYSTCKCCVFTNFLPNNYLLLAK